MATLIKPDGTRTHVEPANGKEFTLRELQELVGGYIEHVSLTEGRHLLVDEDGIAKGLEVNPIASAEVNQDLESFGGLIGYWIRGNALICKEGEMA